MSRPWMPLYIGDYKSNTAHLNTLEHGAYLLLIMHYWECGPLPADEERLAQIALLPVKRFRPVWNSIKRMFEEEIQTEDSKDFPNLGNGSEANAKQMLSKCFRHRRLDAEIEKHEIIKAKRALAGREGGLVSRGKNNAERYVDGQLQQANAKQTGHQSYKRSILSSTEQVEGQQARQEEGTGLASPYLVAAVKRKGWVDG